MSASPPYTISYKRKHPRLEQDACTGGVNQRFDPDKLPDDIDQLKQMCFDLQLENDLMKGVVEIIKKDHSVDLKKLTNTEKTLLIDGLRPTYSLICLANRSAISLPSYCYARASLRKSDKYEAVRAVLREEFAAVGRSRGYRFLHARLCQRSDVLHVNEKKVRELMR